MSTTAAPGADGEARDHGAAHHRPDQEQRDRAELRGDEEPQAEADRERRMHRRTVSQTIVADRQSDYRLATMRRLERRDAVGVVDQRSRRRRDRPVQQRVVRCRPSSAPGGARSSSASSARRGSSIRLQASSGSSIEVVQLLGREQVLGPPVAHPEILAGAVVGVRQHRRGRAARSGGRTSSAACGSPAAARTPRGTCPRRTPRRGSRRLAGDDRHQRRPCSQSGLGMPTRSQIVG